MPIIKIDTENQPQDDWRIMAADDRTQGGQFYNKLLEVISVWEENAEGAPFDIYDISHHITFNTCRVYAYNHAKAEQLYNAGELDKWLKENKED